MATYKLEKTITSSGKKEIVSQGLDLETAEEMKEHAEKYLQECISLCDELEKETPDIESLNLDHDQQFYSKCPIPGTFEIIEE